MLLLLLPAPKLLLLLPPAPKLLPVLTVKAGVEATTVACSLAARARLTA